MSIITVLLIFPILVTAQGILEKKIYSQHIFAPNRLIEEKPHLVLCPNSGNKQNASSGLGQVATETITELNELWSVNIVRMP